MRRRGLYLRNICIAYPGTLGPKLPDPRPGYAFIEDEDENGKPNGTLLKDDDGNYLEVRLSGSQQ